jgi:hypothetical protein
MPQVLEIHAVQNACLADEVKRGARPFRLAAKSAGTRAASGVAALA